MAPKEAFHRFFRLAVLAKGLDGVLDVLSGFLLAAVSAETVRWAALLLVRRELLEDPADAVANLLLGYAHGFGDYRAFLILYLLVHGAVKVGVSFALWRGSPRTYLASGAVLALAILYQSARLVHAFSPLLLLVTLWDGAILALLPREYRRLLRKV